MKQKSIAILIPNLSGGGAERVALYLANSFIKKNYVVHLVLMQHTGALLSLLHPKVRIIDLKVSRMRYLPWALIRYLRKETPNIMLVMMWPLTVIGVLSQKLAKVRTRVFVSEHTSWVQLKNVEKYRRYGLPSLSMKCFFPKAQAIIAVSTGVANDLREIASLDVKKIQVIHNPVIDETVELTREYKAQEPLDWWIGDHFRVLAVGQLKKAKDYITLLKAFTYLCKNLNAKLLILGEGACRQEMESHIQNSNMSDRVFMPGFVVDPTPYLAHANLHVLSSQLEGFGMVIVEALAVGTPVVSTDCISGPREILCDGKFGQLVEVGNAEELARSMELSLTSLHDTQALIKRAHDFTIDKAANQYLQLFFETEENCL